MKLSLHSQSRFRQEGRSISSKFLDRDFQLLAIAIDGVTDRIDRIIFAAAPGLARTGPDQKRDFTTSGAADAMELSVRSPQFRWRPMRYR